MSNACCDLRFKRDIFKLHDLWHNPRYKCQKQITFTPRQFQMEGGPIENKLKAFLRGTQAAYDNFLRPALNTLATVFGMTVAAKSKNPQNRQATPKMSKSISNGKILNLGDTHGQRLGFKLIFFQMNFVK